MPARTALAVTVLLTGFAPAARATPPRYCKLVTDPAGDVNTTLASGSPQVFPADDALDITGGDLAIGAKTVTAVVKTKADPATSPSPLYVRRYIVEFKVAGLPNKVVLAAAFGLDGTAYSYGFTAGDGSYSYDGVATGTGLTITASLADLAGDANLGAVKRGAKVSQIAVSALRRLPPVTASPRGQLVDADSAATSRTYLAGATSCVKAA